MTVGTHIAEILRQGIWASLTGGWYYEPSHSTLCNTVHLYLWILLLVLPIILGLISSGVFSPILLFSYAIFICFLFGAIKLLVSYLHRVFDTTEPIVLTKTKAASSQDVEDKSQRDVNSSSNVTRTRSVEHGFEMVEMADLRTRSPSPRPAASSLQTSHEGGRRRNQRVRIDTQETDIHRVDVHVQKAMQDMAVVELADVDEIEKDSERDDQTERMAVLAGNETTEGSPEKGTRFSVTPVEEGNNGRLLRKMSEPAIDKSKYNDSERRHSEGTSRVRRANSTVEGGISANVSTSGSMLSQDTLAQCRQNTRKSYPMKISSTDEFLNCGNLAKRAQQRRTSSSASIGATPDTKDTPVGSEPATLTKSSPEVEEHVVSERADDQTHIEGGEDGDEESEMPSHSGGSVSVSLSTTTEKDTEKSEVSNQQKDPKNAEDVEESNEGTSHSVEECKPSTSRAVDDEYVSEPAVSSKTSTSAWSPVVVSFSTERDRPSTSALHRAKERIANPEDLPGTSDGAMDLKGEITRFLEDLIDKHPETLDAIESVRQSRLGRVTPRGTSTRNAHSTHPHVARWSGSRRASQSTAMSVISDLALRDGTHIAQGHEDTTQGAVHSFQDEDGNWWTYAFDENGRGTAQALGSGRALMELLQSAPTLPVNKLEVLPESTYASSDDEDAKLEEGGASGGPVVFPPDRDRSARTLTHRCSRSRAASSSSNDSQVYIPQTPSAVFHAQSSAVATRGSQIGRSQPHMASLVNAAARIRAVLHSSTEEDRTSDQGLRMTLLDSRNAPIMDREREHGLYELEQRLRLLRMDSAGSSSSRFRFLADLGLATPSLAHAPAASSLDPVAFIGARRPSSAKKSYYYRLKMLPKSDRSFKLKMDRLSVAALFDRNRSVISGVFDALLAALVSLLAGFVISKAIYHDVSLVAFAFVVAGAHFSLLKSVQPDAASPIHGFNWLVAYSRPIYFCILCSLLLWVNNAVEGANEEIIPWNWNLYRWSSTSWVSVIASLRDLLSTIILLLPTSFTLGWLPQVNTLVLHILEQLEMHMFGGSACISVLAAFIQVAKSLVVWAIVSSFAYLAHQTDSTSSQTVAFSAFCAVTVTLSFILSRLPSNPQLLLLALRPLKCLFVGSSAPSPSTRHHDGDTRSEQSGTRLLCTGKPKQAVNEAASDDWGPSSPSALSPSDPLPGRLLATLSLRTRHDLLFSFFVTLLVFALHSTSLFTATNPYFTIATACVAIVVGAFNHYLYMQLRVHYPWKLVAKPVLRSHEFAEFESTNPARLMWFEWLHVWLGAVERNVLYPLLVVSMMTEVGWKMPYPVVLMPLIAIRILRGGFCAPQMMYIPLALSFLLTRVDWKDNCPIDIGDELSSSDLFPIVFFVTAVIYPKWIELYLKLSFVLAYVAPWQISWGSAFHAFAQPFSVPHSALVWLQTFVSSLISAPLNPFLGSSFFTTSYVRPVKFWERDYNTKRSDASNTRLASQIDRGPMMDDSNLNAVFYEHLTRSLQTSLAGDLAMGRWATSIQPGDCFILASFYLNCLVHIIEVGNGFVTFQLRGLEFRGTYCHQREVEAISEDTSQGAGCCCCSPGTLPGLLSLNTAWSLRWLAWEVTASKYIIEGYSITDNSAVNLLQVNELRCLLVSLYVKCIIYYTLKSDKLTSWLLNDMILQALKPMETNPRYVDVDHFFCAANDEDYDLNNMGISRQSFSELYTPWIDFCTQKRADGDLDLVPEGSPLVSLCLALSLLGRRALGAASYNRHSNAAESFLYGLHALFKGDFRVTCQRDEWVFADMDLLRCVIAPSVRMALKLHQDHFAASVDFDVAHCMYDLIASHEENLFISHEHDPGWRRAILSNTPSLLALRHIYDDGQDDYKIIMLNKMHLNMRVIKLNRECVRAFWTGQQQELIFLRNRNPERGSIQNARQVLRNMINSSADQPVGYPIYVSPLTTSFVETHPQISVVQGPPLTVEGIGDVLRCAWSGLCSHFGTSGSSSLGPASCGAVSNAATAGSQAPPPSSAPSLRPMHSAGQATGTVDPDGLSSSSSQPEQSVVSVLADGSAHVSLCRVRAESTPPAHRRVQLSVGRHSVPTSLQREIDQSQQHTNACFSKMEAELAKEDEENAGIYVEIVDVEQIFKYLDEPLKATGEPLVMWPKENWRAVGGRSSWDWMPMDGWVGQVIYSWYPNHPQRALRSHIGYTIHLVSLFDMPNSLVPISEKGIRILSADEVRAVRGRNSPTSLVAAPQLTKAPSQASE